jgi:hypothetical protein
MDKQTLAPFIARSGPARPPAASKKKGPSKQRDKKFNACKSVASALICSEISERTPKSRRRSFLEARCRAGIPLPLAHPLCGLSAAPNREALKLCVGDRTLYALIYISGWQPPTNEGRSLTKAVK